MCVEASEICFPLSLRLLKAIRLSSCRLTACAFPEALQSKYGILRIDFLEHRLSSALTKH